MIIGTPFKDVDKYPSIEHIVALLKSSSCVGRVWNRRYAPGISTSRMFKYALKKGMKPPFYFIFTPTIYNQNRELIPHTAISYLEYIGDHTMGGNIYVHGIKKKAILLSTDGKYIAFSIGTKRKQRVIKYTIGQWSGG